jgi:S-adenosylmethionine:tRNA ribosyltransferase-isomerase
MSNDLFNYDLPQERIALFPLEQRDNSKLLIYENNNIQSDIFRNLQAYISTNSLIIRNSTRVQKARLFLTDKSGRIFEIFCLKSEMNISKSLTNSAQYECLIKGIKKLKIGDVLTTEKYSEESNSAIKLSAEFINRKKAHASILFSWNNSALNFNDIMELFGVTPLPPYIKRDAIQDDAVRYQTVYARQDGSVAAPTAGLHFTDTVIEKLMKNNISFAEVILHVGLGTFQPMQDSNLKNHQMHSERFTVSRLMIDSLIQNADLSITAVGTTTLRTLESLYLLAHRITKQTQQDFIVHQWEAEQISSFLKPIEAWKLLAEYMDKYTHSSISGNTSLMITPEYQCKTIDYIITNFHQPNSTLLLIISSLIGEKWKTVYDYALQNDFRFLSYGDVCLLKNMRK